MKPIDKAMGRIDVQYNTAHVGGWINNQRELEVYKLGLKDAYTFCEYERDAKKEGGR